MSPGAIVYIMATLEKIGRAKQEQEFREWMIEAIDSIVNQINSINHDQMQEISRIFTRIEWIQYGLIVTILWLVIWIVFIIVKMNRRIKALEFKINQI